MGIKFLIIKLIFLCIVRVIAIEVIRMDIVIVKPTNFTMSQDHTKILAMFVLGAGSFFIGMLPAWLSRRQQRNHPLLISVLLCFGAGVLLATSLVHMLPEVREKMPQWSEIILCVGFFIVYAVDELVHFFCGEAIQHRHHQERSDAERNARGIPNYHATAPVDSSAFGAAPSTSCETQSLLPRPSTSIGHDAGGVRECVQRDEVANSRICHVSHAEPCEETLTGHLGLLCALSLHSLLEGLAIGIQDSASKVILLVGAVAAHKYVVGFCLGVELSANSRSTVRSHFFAILIFAFGSVAGIGIGMGLVDLQSDWSATSVPILQGLAAGTLLYVTVCEVMPREKARWHQRRRSAGLAQFLAVIIGFIILTAMNMFITE
ncbi:zinc transporter ZIP3 isoform X2 [Phlebotomus papatasi]|uniref:zinc transporter ZIP3 isoform X2 n=1 Tax=Phlebotomus papatasi TaxID=29031 RepID=UPI0024839454|nr:zinc transporter ZIP3 isoform X2 [Phlebotomus papatasi]